MAEIKINKILKRLVREINETSQSGIRIGNLWKSVLQRIEVKP